MCPRSTSRRTPVEWFLQRSSWMASRRRNKRLVLIEIMPRSPSMLNPTNSLLADAASFSCTTRPCDSRTLITSPSLRLTSSADVPTTSTLST